MAQYFKKNIRMSANAFYAYHGTPINGYYPAMERVTFDPTYSHISGYEIQVKGIIYDDLVPCTRQEFEEAKTAALDAITALMDTDAVEIGHQQELQAA